MALQVSLLHSLSLEPKMCYIYNFPSISLVLLGIRSIYAASQMIFLNVHTLSYKTKHLKHLVRGVV